MDARRVGIGIGAAIVLLAGGVAAGFLIGNDSGSGPVVGGVPDVRTIERTVTEQRVVEREPRRGLTPREAWQGPGHPLVRIRRGAPLPVHDAPRGETVKRLGARTEFGSPRWMWVAERRGPWLGVVAPELGNNRLGWLRFDPERQRFGTATYSLRVDLSDRLVEVRRGGRTVRRVVVSVGRFGAGTPPGRFAVTDRITRGLDDVYGCCAIALSARQPNLPAGWIGGDRIALHGWNGPVGEAASGGCLRAGNRDMRWLMERVSLGAPVFVEA